MTQHPPRAPGDAAHWPVAPSASPFQAAGGGAPVAERLARALCATGIVVGIASVVELLAPLLLGSGSLTGSLRFRRPYEVLFLFHAVLTLTSSVLLFTGSVGELRRKGWGRTLLILYVWLWLAGAVASMAGMYTYRVEYPYAWGADRRGMLLVMMAQHVGYVALRGAYPLLLAVWLRWPESRRAASNLGGFRPVLPAGGE